MLPADKNLGHMTLEEKYDFAKKYKDAGNVFFKEGKYEFASKNYTETITYIRHGLRMGETDSDGVPIGAKARGGLEPAAKAIIASCYSNMAACALKLGKLEDVIKHATNAIESDLKGNVKPTSKGSTQPSIVRREERKDERRKRRSPPPRPGPSRPERMRRKPSCPCSD